MTSFMMSIIMLLCYAKNRKVARYSTCTINDYNRTFKKLLEFIYDVEMSYVARKVTYRIYGISLGKAHCCSVCFLVHR
jgi:hypothetical protein